MASTSIKNKEIGITELPQLEEYEFDWDIKRISTFQNGIQTFVHSPIFNVGLCKWSLLMTPGFYPGGYRNQRISFTMDLIDPAPENSYAKYELFIRNKDVIIKPVKFDYPGSNFFEKCETKTQFRIFFENMEFADDTLRLTCKVKLYNLDLEKTALLPGSLVEEPSDKVLKDYARLFETMENADISIKVGENILLAHKAILSIRSTVFERMFGVEMKESAEIVVQIDDFGLEDVKSMLEFIYTGQTEAVKKDPENLLQLAEKYNLPDLKSACGVQLSQGITVENAIERLYLADRINIPGLKSFVENFIISNKKELVKTDAFKDAPASLLKLFANIIAQD